MFNNRHGREDKRGMGRPLTPSCHGPRPRGCLFGNPINEFQDAFFRREGEFLNWYLINQLGNKSQDKCHALAVPKWGKRTGKEL